MQSSLPGVITIASFPFGPGFPGIPFSPSKPGSPGIPGGPTGPLGHLFSVRMLHWHLHDVDFVEKKWRRDKTEKHTENAETSGQNGHRLHGKCSIQFFTTIHAVFMRTSVKLLLL
ncbi:putative proline-rich protein [Trichinella spiralis]|uniref:putative proline-rich protein n=1 Tax=Trichinella spiralis TaxID=6334 RepID=UPI0001EFCCE4|nr:putative proline-rich protein [Trichinella spiralis]